MRATSALPAICLGVAISLPVPGFTDGGYTETPVSQVISGDAVWQGEVTVDGIVIVTKTGTLTVSAGTTVRFVPRDDDGDGIGDSELRVEGELKVRGTESAPVLFTSAGTKPEAADWKYVMVNHARGVSMANAVIEYAYSGVQVHYTRGAFKRLTARKNVDGFRFSTAPVTLTDSLLTENENGIRFEERGAGAVIRENRVIRNRIGVFAVVKCRGLTVFDGNIIEENDDYNVKMGLNQVDDVSMKGNWWGETAKSGIEESFFDGRKETGLGKVIYDPYLNEKPDLSK